MKEALNVKIEKEKIERIEKIEQFEKVEKFEVFIEKKIEKKIEEDDFRKCSICMERDKDTCLGCGHLYCNQCVELISKRNNECPTCSKLITSKIKVFL